jgi:hypothetical protein
VVQELDPPVAARSRSVERRLLLGVCALALAALAVPFAVNQLRGTETQGHAVPLVSAAGLEARSGVRILGLTLAGDGGLLDLRYQVVDAQKAVSVHDGPPPMLVEESTNAAIAQLLMGHQHSSAPKVGLSYYLVFLNEGSILHIGSRVSVQLGDARVAHVVVR